MSSPNLVRPQNIDSIEREMELNRLDSEDTGVKTQMTVINKQSEDKTAQQKTTTTKKNQQTPKTVPNNTLQDDQCRYCKNTGHKAADCVKLALRRQLEEDPDAMRCAHCNGPMDQDMRNQQATSEQIWKIAPRSGLSLKHRKN